MDPPKQLVASGPYRLVRNPMYIAVLTVLLGEAALFGAVELALFAGGFFLVVHAFVLLYEEPTLMRQFGAAYDEYCSRVRRWLPGRPKRP